MEREGPMQLGGIRPAALVALAERPGPFATVWIPRVGLGRYGGQPDDVVSRRIGDELRRAGAPDAVVDAVGAALERLDPGAAGAVAVADASGVALVEELPEPPRAERATWSGLPALAPVLEHRQAQIPAMIVLADRTGADITVVRAGRDDMTIGVEGEDHPVTKSAPGGLSQSRYQQRAEDSWQQNAHEVAERLTTLAADEFPELLILGGDVRAVELIRGALSAELDAVTRIIDPGRAADGSEDQREQVSTRLVNTAVAEETVGLLQAFRQEDGRGARAANGPAATMAALRRSQVDVLLIHDDGSSEHEGWYGTEPGDVGCAREDLLASEPTRGRLPDVAIRAALRTGAAVRIVPDADVLDGGVGALLRWTG